MKNNNKSEKMEFLDDFFKCYDEVRKNDKTLLNLNFDGNNEIYKLQLEAERAREEKQKILATYKTLQENTRKSESLVAEILKGLQSGEDRETLFLKAIKTISLMTSNQAFYNQAKEYITIDDD